MPSYSEPPTPLRDDDYLYTSLETSSCDDIKHIQSYVKVSSKRNTVLLVVVLEFVKRFLIDSLRCFARSNGGLILDQYRAQIWPVLAHRLVTSAEGENVDDNDSLSFMSESYSSVASSLTQDTEDSLRKHPEWHQVELDVHRTLARFPPNISDDRRSTLQCQLTPLIIRVLRTNPRFRYYQGFHDVCLTVLLVCGAETAFEVCRSLAHYGPFRSYLLKSLEESVLKELEFLYVILSRVDPHLERVLREVRLGTMFALSWPLTWFSHSLNEYQQIVRFFDVF
uniref:Rab-GAP TBC domain-containing protein n=1 Tax=Angiostrongylus cantonensis TaxID=6313 RepID=A0A0K0DPX6_ANGCA